jgi:hypothetical protein
MKFKEFYKSVPEGVSVTLTEKDLDTGIKRFVGTLPISSVENNWKHYDEWIVTSCIPHEKRIEVSIQGGNILRLSDVLAKCPPKTIVNIDTFHGESVYTIYRGEAKCYSGDDYRIRSIAPDFNYNVFLQIFVMEIDKFEYLKTQFD